MTINDDNFAVVDFSRGQRRRHLGLLSALVREIKAAGADGRSQLWALRDWNEIYCDPPLEDDELWDLVDDPQWSKPLPPSSIEVLTREEMQALIDWRDRDRAPDY